ncbi:MAG: carboxypeptidase-like regulatory domain-containing protein [Ferruginibacter sp.]|nr:carboxypeptidase-like regulatory domain-containing protein [Ferruginibacter sp.]
MLIRADSFLLIFFFFCNAAVHAQFTISGKVVNDETGLPVAGASIYFNNTSIGTSSSALGHFSLNSVDILHTELVVSSVGYNVLVVKLDGATANGKYFLCRLSIKEQLLKDVLILSDEKKRKWLKKFRENFVGITEDALMSNIENEQDIYFTRGADDHIFNAYSDQPLVIVNRMLGYKLHFQLVEFSFNEATGRTYFYGYTRYEELGDKKSHARNRLKAYTGSTLHFYRALLKDQLQKEGFDIYLIKKVQIDSSALPMSVAVGTSCSKILSTDTSDRGYHRITVTGKLMVQFKKDPASKYYLKNKRFLQGNMPVGVRSFIIPNTPFILIDDNGILADPLCVEYSGFWIYEKAANLLPYNYQP